ncbi:EamA family transporter [Clostridium bovifaecis]|uniref:EamA family transporter n=1 Tax=Clostridium bovifaecis TaxID=2184719 RepID=A0A6I6FAB0_9CLOT|nr:EamA family transporter [Clostridium bovifaecis]
MRKRKYILMILTTFFWAGAFIAGKVAIKEFTPFSLTFLRFLIATLVLFPVAFKAEGAKLRLKKEDLPILIILGLLGMFGYHVLFFFSLKYTTAINSSMIGASTPVITTVLAFLIIGDKLSSKRTFAILLAFFGVMLTISNGSLDTIRRISFNLGDLIMISAVIIKALYIVLSKKVSHRYSPITMTFYCFLVCVILSIPFTIMEQPWSYINSVTWKGWLSLVYMATLPSCVGYLIQQVSIKAVGPSKTTVFENLVPVFSIILSVVILGEKVIILKIVSAMVIILGVYINSTVGSDKQKQDEKAVINKKIV